jgi:hypothetical protein
MSSYSDSSAKHCRLLWLMALMSVTWQDNLSVGKRSVEWCRPYTSLQCVTNQLTLNAFSSELDSALQVQWNKLQTTNVARYWLELQLFHEAEFCDSELIMVSECRSKTRSLSKNTFMVQRLVQRHAVVWFLGFMFLWWLSVKDKSSYDVIKCVLHKMLR